MMTDPFPIGLDDPDDLEVAGFKPKHRQLEPPKRWGRPVRALLQREYDSVPAAGHQLVKGLRGLCGAAVGVLVALGLAAYFCSIIALAVYNSSSLLDPSSAPPDAASLPADAGALPARLPQAVLPSAADARWEDPGGPLPATTTARIEAWQGGGATSLSPHHVGEGQVPRLPHGQREPVRNDVERKAVRGNAPRPTPTQPAPRQEPE